MHNLTKRVQNVYALHFNIMPRSGPSISTHPLISIHILLFPAFLPLSGGSRGKTREKKQW